jgi:hypothetical protein
MRKTINRLVLLAAAAAAAAAIVEQMRRPPSERTWHGSVLGVIPYDFRPPNFERVKQAWWNPDDPRLFTPRAFGIGWAVNLHRLLDMVLTPARTNGDDGV